jgi:hypothetical protein
MDAQSERMHILERIERGEISVDEGLNLIETLPEPEETTVSTPLLEDSSPGQGEMTVSEAEKEPAEAEIILPYIPAGDSSAPSAKTRPAGLPPDAEKWKQFWMVPLWIGVALTALGGWLMYLAIESSGFGFWFICAALLFTLGVIVITLAWQSQFSPWLHLRVQQRPGEYPQRIAFSFPLPVRPAAWFLRNFGQHIQGLESSSLDEVLLSVDQVTRSENPIYIQVDEGEEGEKVEIYIG